ncbi:heterokaryon incompatibility protein-domain-containing protein [Xylariales sp. AK1849]|nr:heterokaryon incompatibility protein-domain-containing protein [Xylariales sp. AK1849]
MSNRLKESVKRLKEPLERQQYPDFQYSKLDASTQEIRLVTILPGVFREPIRVEISHAPLVPPEPKVKSQRWTLEELRKTVPEDWRVVETIEDRIIFITIVDGKFTTSWNHPDPDFPCEAYGDRYLPQHESIKSQFEALSYVWGDEREKNTVVVHDPGARITILRIRPNLAVALRHLRHMSEPRVMWIDALCINQMDDKERSEQVQRMGQIFSLAQRVVAWLGAGSSDSRLALTTLEQLAEKVEVTTDGSMLPLPGSADVDILDPGKGLQFEKRIWAALSGIFQRKWFMRLWILQEIQLANKYSIIQCGDDGIPWPLFEKGVKLLDLNDRDHPPELLVPLFDAVRTCDRSTQLPLELLLNSSGFRDYSEPADRTYGLLNLITPRLAQSVQVNYSLSIMELFGDVFWAHVDLTRRLNLLRFSDGALRASDTSAWPSWLPDLRNCGSTVCPDVETSFSTASMSASHISHISSSEIQVAGFQVATISSVKALNIRNTRGVTSFIQGRGLESLRATPYVAGGTRLDANLQALALGCLQPRFPHHDCITLQTLKKAVVPAGDERNAIGNEADRYSEHYLGRLLYKKALFDTREGYIGIARQSVQPDDQVFILLGCEIPVILRQTPRNTYELASSCYMHGVMDGETVLGPLQQPWEIRNKRFGDQHVTTYYNTETDVWQSEDPRLKAIPLPPEWEPMDWKRTRDDPSNCCMFRNRITGEVINSDPRLSMEALNERGLPGGRNIEMLTLV